MKYFKVTNKGPDIRKFRDKNTGKDILLSPKASVITNRPPKPHQFWKIEQCSEPKTKKVIKNGNRSEDK